MAEFESWKQYWDFSQFVMRKARHILDVKNQRFLNTVIETTAKRVVLIEKGAVLWRAQIGNDWDTEVVRGGGGEEIDSFEVEGPLSPARMVPLPDRAFEGRVNPKGIPCLYLSTEMETAMTEVRPWIGSCVSVAQFVILRELKVVDCSAESEWRGLTFEHLTGMEPDADVREGLVWGRINRAFSQPVTRSDDVAEYAPTQVLAEAFRSAGYDGIVYGSKLGTGRTVALFDVADAEPANCHLYRVAGVNLKFSMAANPYYLEKYSKTELPKGSNDPVGSSEHYGSPDVAQL